MVVCLRHLLLIATHKTGSPTIGTRGKSGERYNNPGLFSFFASYCTYTMFLSVAWPLLFFSPALVAAQGIVQNANNDGSPSDFTAPTLPDLTTTIREGEQFTVEWTSGLSTFFSRWGSDTDLTNVTLWIASGGLNYTQVIGREYLIDHVLSTNAELIRKYKCVLYRQVCLECFAAGRSV